ncbi:MAG: hypothetical protein R2695_18880 [Acidimicrobiales bacterium]
MARRRGITRDDVIATALALVDHDGIDALSLTAVAAALDVQPPSLYSHVEGVTGLLDDLAIVATEEFGEALRDSVVGVSGDAAVLAFADAYRAWATAYPGRYELPCARSTPPTSGPRAVARSRPWTGCSRPTGCPVTRRRRPAGACGPRSTAS